jgi:hypothetical protein
MKPHIYKQRGFWRVRVRAVGTGSYLLGAWPSFGLATFHAWLYAPPRLETLP